jgi:hypothetical protein
LRYQETGQQGSVFHGLLPKVGDPEAVSALARTKSGKTIALYTTKQGKHSVYWVRVPGYFCQFLREPPMARPEAGGAARVRGEVNAIRFEEKSLRDVVHAVLNSSTYYQFFCAYTDTRHINPSDVSEFPLDPSSFNSRHRADLVSLSATLTKCFSMNTTQWRKSGLLIDSIDAKPCKPTIDEIDSVLARHYGFTEKELDFIINYDIKYRMGRDAEGEDE